MDRGSGGGRNVIRVSGWTRVVGEGDMLLVLAWTGVVGEGDMLLEFQDRQG